MSRGGGCRCVGTRLAARKAKGEENQVKVKGEGEQWNLKLLKI